MPSIGLKTITDHRFITKVFVKFMIVSSFSRNITVWSAIMLVQLIHFLLKKCLSSGDLKSKCPITESIQVLTRACLRAEIIFILPSSTLGQRHCLCRRGRSLDQVLYLVALHQTGYDKLVRTLPFVNQQSSEQKQRKH